MKLFSFFTYSTLIGCLLQETVCRLLILAFLRNARINNRTQGKSELYQNLGPQTREENIQAK